MTIHQPIVGIGASAGGIDAFRAFFENMPSDTGMSFVVILHLPVDRKSLLSEILVRWTDMRVIEATEGCLVKPNCVYLPPPGIALRFWNGSLHPHPHASNDAREPTPIDLFFDSLAVALNEDAIGIVLSGTGSDGTLGLKAIKERGGLTLAQETTGLTAMYPGMPSSAAAAGAVDIVAAIEAMPEHILGVQKARLVQSAVLVGPAEQVEGLRLSICKILVRELGHDFSGYKTATFLRRVERRMHILRLANVAEYLVHLDERRSEAILLFRDLLIGVTSFFRDAATFEVLKRTVMPRLFEGKGADATLRVWVPGCATGEEAYSLAILLREHAAELDRAPPKIQVFATDIDDSAVSTARTGRYPSTLLEGMSPDRLSRFFVAGKDGSYTVARQIRELCTFSVHSLIRDPPYSRTDLISCRNLLIYLDSNLQSVVMPAFHYSLVSDGILLLGSSETVSQHGSLFATLDKRHRIYRRRDALTPPLRMSGRIWQRAAIPGRDLSKESSRGGSSMETRATARVLARFAPAFVVVSAEGDILQYSSRVGKFLQPAPGLPARTC